MFLIGPFAASRVNVLQNDFAAGLPAPTAFVGLAASVAPAVGAPRWGVGVLPLIHEISVSPGQTRGQMSKDVAGIKVLDIPADMTGTVRFSLIVDLPAGKAGQIMTAVSTARLAGGLIFPCDDAKMVEIQDGASLRRIAPGRLILPLAGLPVARRTGDVEAWLAAVFPSPVTDDAGDKVPTGWRVPLAVGFGLLEDPATAPRRGATRSDAVPHVFAEPIAGVGELASHKSARVRGMSVEDLRALCWKYHTRGDVVAAHRAYLPEDEPQKEKSLEG